jgi:hypothetical protein
MEGLHNNRILSVQKTENDLLNHATSCFDPLYTETATIDGDLLPIPPDGGQVTDQGPYLFTIPSNGRYIDPKETRMFFEFSIVDKTGATITAKDNCSVVNFIGSSFIKEIETLIDGKPVGALTNDYVNYKTYIENIISYDKNSLARIRSCALAYMDVEDKFDTMTQKKVGTTENQEEDFGDTGDTRNRGFVDRRRIIMRSHEKKVQIYIPFPCDYWQTLKYLAPGLALTLRITRSDDKFLLLADETSANASAYKLKVHAFRLYVRFVDIQPSIMTSHQQALQQNKMILIPFNKTVVKTHLYYPGISEIYHQNLYTGLSLPKTIIIVLCTNTQVDGSYTTNPYKFAHNNVTEMYVKINGVKAIPSDYYRPDFAKNRYIREYQMFMENLGLKFNDVSCAIDYGMWAGGCCLWTIDTSPDVCGGYHRHEKRSGHIDLTIKMSTNLTSPTYLMCFANYDAVLGIDRDMNVRVDY